MRGMWHTELKLQGPADAAASAQARPQRRAVKPPSILQLAFTKDDAKVGYK